MSDEAYIRHHEEAAFFDDLARKSRESLSPVDPRVLDRYRNATADSARFPLEYAIALVRCAEAPRVLDVGCGDGSNAVLMASLGANVTGFDVSPESIAIAKERARINGIEERTRFMVGTAESFGTSEIPFDVVWCDAVLHHVIPQLDQVLTGLRRLQSPSGRTVIMEPVSRSRLLRRLRSAIPLRTEATPGERPLRSMELGAIQQAYPGIAARYFRILGRMDRLVLHGTILERASTPKRVAMRVLAATDHLLNKTPLSRFASIVVMHTGEQVGV